LFILKFLHFKFKLLFMDALKRLLLAVMCLFITLASFAQSRQISGTILSQDDNTPLVGVTVTNRATNQKVQTDANGKFIINADKGQVLIFTYVGFTRQEVRVGDDNTISTRMASSQGQLGEVVVTAMDIKRNPRELGYSVQTVKGAEIQETQRENFVNSLQGRVAGLTINQSSGAAGASSSIVLRGFNSLSMSNQPLFVIDGVIVDNTTLDENSMGGQGVGIVDRGAGLTSTNNQKADYNNRISDINPNDIESITVLKGPEATALYGSQASSGAIIITTRKAKSNRLAIQYDNSFRVQKITRYPKTIDAYSPGENGDTASVFRYFGPAYEPGTQKFNNKEAFFKTGFAQTHNLGVDFGIKNSFFRFSSSLFDQDGVVPNNTYKRYTFRLSNSTKIGKYLDITPAISYTRTDNNKVLRSTGGFMVSLLSFPNTTDITQYKADDGSKTAIFNKNSDNPNSEIDNPLFNVNSNKSYEETDRYNATLGININPTSWLSLAGRFGYERYNTEGYLRYHPLSYYLSLSQRGMQDNFWRKYEGYNHTITATAKKTIGKDINLRLMGGTMWQDYETQMYAVSGTGLVDAVTGGKMYKNGVIVTDANINQLVGHPSDSNATLPSSRQRLLQNTYGRYNQSILRQIAYFGEFAASYKNYLFLNYTHRFEQASTLPEQNRNYNYPGASLSAIVSDIIPAIKNNVISYVKVRGSVAATARLNSPYSTQSVFVNNLSSGGGFSYGFVNNNPDLEPEKQKTFEIGTEWRLFNSRINLDATYYNTLNKGQIIEQFRLSYGTGYVLNTQNAGSTRNKGVEISLEGNILKKTSFNWNMRLNFNKMWNKVIEMPKNVAEYYIADTWVYENARGGMQLGNPTTTITSFGYMRNNKGDLLISPTTGLPISDDAWRIRGDRNPDFTLGLVNSIDYKNLRLSFLWDAKIGGDVFNGTEMYLTRIGRSRLTADRMTPRVIEGVLDDGLANTANPTKNTISIIPYQNDNYYRTMKEEAFIEKDVNWLRLRDVTLNYTLPAKLSQKIRGVKSLGVFVTANDLVIITNYTGADPGVNANSAGARGVGAFGFDYGSLPAPISLNFGLRASF
jgi:TonB-linked SusC/RagA family outer membrane protein